MPALIETAPDTCYDCGREVLDAQEVAACLWKSHEADGAEHWGLVAICPDCARGRARRRQMWLSVVFVLVALLTSALAYPLLP